MHVEFARTSQTPCNACLKYVMTVLNPKILTTTVLTPMTVLNLGVGAGTRGVRADRAGLRRRSADGHVDAPRSGVGPFPIRCRASCQPTPYPVGPPANLHPIHCQPTPCPPYPANGRSIHCKGLRRGSADRHVDTPRSGVGPPKPYPLPIDAHLNPFHCQPTPCPPNGRPILPTAALSCQRPPYPANGRPIHCKWFCCGSADGHVDAPRSGVGPLPIMGSCIVCEPRINCVSANLKYLDIGGRVLIACKTTFECCNSEELR